MTDLIHKMVLMSHSGHTQAPIKKIVAHADCPDGLAAAMLARDAFHAVDLEFVQYSTRRHVTMEPEPGVLFVDFTPWVEREKDPPHAMTARGRELAQAWVDAGAVVLDHHRGAGDLVAMFGDRGVYADEMGEPGVSGALLAYRHVWCAVFGNYGDSNPNDFPNGQLRHFAEIAGVRDTWQRQDPRWREACAQAAALMFWPGNSWIVAGDVDWAEVRQRLASGVGEVLLEQQEASDRRTADEAYRFRVTSVRVACFQGSSREASDVSELLGDEVDLVLAWRYLVEHEDRDGWGSQRRFMRVSARAKNGGFACDALAKAHGGNGHQGAAGFKLEVGGASHNPYTALEGLVLAFLGAAATRGGR